MRGLALGGGGKCHIVDHISYYAGDSSDDSRFMVTLCDREVIARDYFQTFGCTRRSARRASIV